MRPYSPDLDAIRIRFSTFREDGAAERTAIASELAARAGGEHVLIETCHRVELVTVDGRRRASRKTSAVTGREAVRRVFEVVAGFDSAVLAEEQILGQARTAYESALARGSTGPMLNELFRRALRFGRRVRTHARPGSDRSLADRASAWLGERTTPSARVAVVGTGEMARLAARRLAETGRRITVVSRSHERASSLVRELPGVGHRVAVGEPSGAALAQIEGLLIATRSRGPVLTSEALAGREPPWVVDLSLPDTLDSDVVEALGDRLLTVDQLGALRGAAPALAPAVERRLRLELEAEVERFAAWVEGRRGSDAVATLRMEADAVRRRHVERLRARGRLTAEQLAAVDAATAAMLGELLHGPTIELRRGGPDAELVRRLFGVEA